MLEMVNSTVKKYEIGHIAKAINIDVMKDDFKTKATSIPMATRSAYVLSQDYPLFLHFSHNPFMTYSDSTTVKVSGIGTCGIMMLSRQMVLWHLMHVR